jgi:hypothetical protein
MRSAALHTTTVELASRHDAPARPLRHHSACLGPPDMTRLLILAVVMVFISGFGFLTLSAVSQQGFTLASAISIFVLVLLGVGIVGALLNPPRR